MRWVGPVTVTVRSVRRWLRRALNRVSASKQTAPVHLPDFSGSRLRAALAGREGAAEATLSHPHPAVTGETPAILVRARERFGSRFFVPPDTVSSLWQQLGDEYPTWRERQVEAVRSDGADGIPIYNRRGPRIGADFPWNDLTLGPDNDGLYAKRPHRFAFAPRHALACHHDPGAAARLHGMLDGWMSRAGSGEDRCCYDSNLGVIQRLLALSWAWAFLAGRGSDAGAEEQALEWTVLCIIEADVRFLEPRLGRSAPNNHLLADRFAVWYLRVLFPELLDTESDGSEESRWRDELLRQTYPDGGSFEHSAHYHEFACEMGCAYLLLCRRQGLQPDPAAEARIEALLRFQAALTGPEAVPLPFGNGIEDTLFPLDPAEGWCSGSLRELYRALFRPELAPTPGDNPSWVRAYWLLGGDVADPPEQPDQPPALESFPDAGFHVMADAEAEARLVFRTGPAPGVPVVPGHMHADLLSVYVSVAGHPVIVDAGTYTYRAGNAGSHVDAPPWRQHFAGPCAHNGPVVGKRDPLGALVGDFRRSGEDVRAVGTERASNYLTLIDGRLLGGGPYHDVRRMVVHVRGEYWLVVDIPPAMSDRSQGLTYGFQFDAGSRIAHTASGLTIEHPDCANIVHLAAVDHLETPTVHEGESDPLAGWISPRYGELLPAPQARFVLSDNPAAPSAFVLQVGVQTPAAEPTSIEQDESGAFWIMMRCAGYEDLLLLDCKEGACSPPGHQQVTFRGDLLWLRSLDGSLHELRWVGAEELSLPAEFINVGPSEPDGRRRFP